MVTHDMGHTSTAIPFRLHVSINFGCLIKEYLIMDRS